MSIHCLLGRLLLGAALLWAGACKADGEVADPVGAQALSYIQATPYVKIVGEIDYVDGFAPNKNARKWTQLVLKETLEKDDIVLAHDTVIPAGADPDRTYDLDQIRAIEKANRGQYTQGDTAVMYFLFLDGQYHEDTETSKTLGLAYGGSSVVIFKRTLSRLCTVAANNQENAEYAQALCPLAQATTWVHEVGHLLGLVNNGIPMLTDHHDAATGAHDTNPECIMTWQNNTPEMFDILVARLKQGKSDVSPFDAPCLADIAAARD